MRRVVHRWIIAVGLIIATAAVSDASTIGVDVTGANAFIVKGENLGWQFQVNSAVIVNGLGIFDDVAFSGLSESHQVGLWDNSGNLLASTIVTNAGTHVATVLNNSCHCDGDWLFEDIAPLLLNPGIYVTSSFYSPSSAEIQLATAGLIVAPQISYLASRRSAGGVFAEPVVEPPNLAPSWFGANIRIQDQNDTVPVPEPTSLTLLGIGALCSAARLRRQRRGV